MNCEPTRLNGEFGVLFTDVTRAMLRSVSFRQQAKRLWLEQRGLVVVRGDELANLAGEELIDWAQVFGEVDEQRIPAREFCTVDDLPIIRIGNLTDSAGQMLAVFTDVPPLASDQDIIYNPEILRPVWHTDSTFKPTPPIGSVFHCKQGPPVGGDTLYADMRGALEALDDDTRQHLETLEAVCSLAHHDRKVNLYSPTYPVLSPEQRAANPAQRVPLVLYHPDTGKPALYGMNSSTCTVVPKGQEVSSAAMDGYDLDGIEDDSVMVLRKLLPQVTQPDFTVRWHWQPGDIVVWDNRCTMHAPTGFDHQRFTREMWRLTLVSSPTH